MKSIRHVTVVDDEITQLTVLQAILQHRGYRVSTALSAGEALERLSTDRPDLFVIDWMMPGMSGLELIREIRSRPELGLVPVIVLTARSQASDRQTALEAGASDYLCKPFEPIELLERVAGLLKARGA